MKEKTKQKKKSLVNAQTDKSVPDFIHSVTNKRRREDSEVLLQVMKDITGKEPKIWGRSIIGFGKYSYQRKNGDEFEWFHVGFSPAKAHLSVYLMYNLDNEEEVLNRLGPHKKGKGCLYIKKLEDIDMAVLKEMITKSDRWERS